MKEKSNMIFRRYLPGDAKGIVELMNQTFNLDFSEDWWNWKYEQNPYGFKGENGDIWVAEDEGKIVGHYGIIPEKMKFYSEVIDVAQSVDTATHSNYRGIGVFSKLAKGVYSDAKNRYRFAFGFPSEMARNGFIRLGWRRLSTVPEYFKVLNCDAMARKIMRNPIYGRFGKLLLKTYSNFSCVFKTGLLGENKGQTVEIENVDFFDSGINDFWRCANKYYPIVLQRTEAFLNWRFSKHFGPYQIFVARGGRQKTVVGYVVLKKQTKNFGINTLGIVDLVTLPNEDKAMCQLLDLAINQGSAVGVDCIDCWFPEWHRNTRLLSGKGFIPAKQIMRIGRKDILPIFYYDFNRSLNSLNIRDLYLTYADTDYA